MEVAQKYGKAEHAKYKSFSGESVEWVFVKVEKAYEVIDNLQSDTTEVFSRFLSDSEAKSILQSLA
jgi:mannose/fructose/N-acetylgalactosamine-specific phosphotransferase system component IIB